MYLYVVYKVLVGCVQWSMGMLNRSVCSRAVLPSPPVISGHEHRVYQAGATVTLSCVTSGGTPAPQVVWTKRALEPPDSVGALQWVRVAQSRARSDHPTETRSDITFTVAKEDNNIEFRCEVVASSRRKDMFNATVRLQVGCAPLLLLPSLAHPHRTHSGALAALRWQQDFGNRLPNGHSALIQISHY